MWVGGRACVRVHGKVSLFSLIVNVIHRVVVVAQSFIYRRRPNHLLGRRRTNHHCYRSFSLQIS